MTKKTIFRGMLVMVLAFTMAVIGCDNDPTDPDTTATVTKVIVSAANGATFVNLDNTLQFSAVVSGTNSPPQGVTWSITTADTKAGTSISNVGLLTVASDETAPTLEVMATSTFDKSKSGYAIVTVDDPDNDNLADTITITANGSPVTSSTTGTTLTASYSGTETVTYLWYRNGESLGDGGGDWGYWHTIHGKSATYTPYEPGSYSVLVSADGRNSKFSDTITVTGSVIPPENYVSEADRWNGAWRDFDATVTIAYSVESDGVCAITVGGTAQPNDETDGWGRWKANTSYAYTATANTSYEYTFEAWSDSGDRELGIQYYWDDDTQVDLSTSIAITNERKTYTKKGQNIPKSGHRYVAFQGADKLGTFYVKMLSIEPYTPELGYELIDEETAYRVISAEGMSGAVTIPATYNGMPVTEIGSVDDGHDDGPFFDNDSITSITIPASVKIIGSFAFNWCSSLTTVTFAPNSQLEKISGGAFNACVKLTSIAIPASVTDIGNSAFTNCPSLTNLNVESGNTYYESENGILYKKGKTFLQAYPSASGNIIIPASVETIGGYAFGWSTPTSITIPNSVTTVGWDVFSGWTSSQTINVPFANAGARPSGWDSNWNNNCNAVIKYWNGSSYQ